MVAQLGNKHSEEYQFSIKSPFGFNSVKCNTGPDNHFPGTQSNLNTSLKLL